MLGSMFDEILCARMVMTFVGHFGHTFRSTFLNFFIYFDSRTSLKNSIGHQFFWPRGFLHLECKFLGTLFFLIILNHFLNHDLACYHSFQIVFAVHKMSFCHCNVQKGD